MAEAQLQQFLRKVEALNAFVALTEADPALREALRRCSTHQEVVSLAGDHGFAIGRRWGDPDPDPDPDSHPAAAVAAVATRVAIAAPPAAASEVHLLTGPCPRPGEERTTLLLELPGLRLERIHSCSATGPADGWYDQTQLEWLTLLQGSARIQFADERRPRSLSRGDCLLIEPRRRHRVVATDPDPGTVWLALFHGPAGSG